MRTLSAAAALLVAFGGVQLRAPITFRADCTITGTRERDFLRGTGRADVICAGPEDDYLAGDAGADKLRGGRGTDTVVGGKGRDLLRGGRGEDRLFAIDGTADRVYGNRGVDRCYVDTHDVVRGCEMVHRSRLTAAVSGLSGSLSSTIGSAQDIISAPPCADDPGCGKGQA
jgi:RTX calcium-binding nonapeptide repeat (4 copies)